MYLIYTTSCLAVLGLATSLPQHKSYDESREVTQNLPSYTKLSNEQINHLQKRGFGSTILSFRPTTPVYEEYEEEEDHTVASSQVIQSRTPIYSEENYPARNTIPVQIRPQLGQQYLKRGPPTQYKQQLLEELEDARLKEEEKEEPDRLSILLPQSTFDCRGKTGYYADEGLGCEVFHYCHDNSRHSWICPDGFTFHQVHLICMPPGTDNICEKSSQFHFVNNYLYKPINLEEHQARPNITLKYSDRYYPNNNYENQEYDEEDEQLVRQKQPIRVSLQQAPGPRAQLIERPPSPTPFSPTIRPQTTLGQVFRSPEEINISLQQRRPAYVPQRYITAQY